MSALPFRTFVKRSQTREVRDLPSSFLGRALTVTGVLETDGELRVFGKVLGRIGADRLILETDGFVQGDVIARDVHVGGRLAGRIFALNVTLESSAEITGRVFHNTAAVARGARLDGRMPWRPLSYFEALEQLPEYRP